MTPHFFVSPADIGDGTAVLSETDSRHLTTVLRARSGDALTISDGEGTVWSARHAGVAGGLVTVALDTATVIPLRHPQLTVVHALPKQRKLDEVIQRLTELDVAKIVPVHSQRSQVELDERKAAKVVARWRVIAEAAAKQSKRARLPEITDVGNWSDAFPAGADGVVCWEESTVPLRNVLGDATAPQSFVLGIGPEGGLTPAEVVATGLPDASLGATILRSETAALVAVSAIAYHYGLMEPR